MIPEFSHPAYVWSSYGIFMLIMLWQWAQPLIRRRKVLSNLREAQAEQRAAGGMTS
ncbi:MAG: heme exporter protein CcmD [Wenzhouxiangellaceae bacterium]|nr:heme exporter protein CcmD [Wenzhouxiangellaceae bacterium]